jgi:TolB-like protein
MKRGMLVLAAVMWIGASAMAQELRVVVLPFEGVGPEQGAKGWVARAIQQNLMTELSRTNSVKPVAGTAAAGDQEAALKAGAGAKYVVFGSYQVVESDLRITGQVLDVEKKEAVAGLKATGTLRDLFGLEDVIAAQVKKALPQPQVEAGKADMLAQPVAGAAPGAAVAPRGPVEIGRAVRAADELADEMDRAIERIRYRNTYEDEYNYDRGYRRPYYGNGYGYGYGYPIYYGGPVFISGGAGVIGRSPSSQRYPGTTEFGQPRLSFPNFVPDGNFHKNSRKK